MNITIVTTKKSKKQIPILEDDGKAQKKVKGVPQFREVEEIEEFDNIFETHEHELVGSAAARYAKEKKLPAPPPGMVPTLGVLGNGLLTPKITIKTAQKLSTKFVLAGWDSART
jgi:hypothetical protein